MEFEHKRFGKCVVSDITQKQLEEFHRALKGKESEPMSVWRGETVRQAVKLGIMAEPKMTVEQVDESKPSLIIWLADCVAKAFAEAVEVDPLS